MARLRAQSGHDVTKRLLVRDAILWPDHDRAFRELCPVGERVLTRLLGVPECLFQQRKGRNAVARGDGFAREVASLSEFGQGRVKQCVELYPLAIHVREY